MDGQVYRRGLKITQPVTSTHHSRKISITSSSQEELEEEAIWREDLQSCYGMSDIIDYLRDFERDAKDFKYKWKAYGALLYNNVEGVIIPTQAQRKVPYSPRQRLKQKKGASKKWRC